MTTTTMSAKEIAAQVTIQCITAVHDEGLRGEEAEHKVCEILANFAKLLPGLSFIPAPLIALVLEETVDIVEEEFAKVDIKSFVKKHY